MAHAYIFREVGAEGAGVNAGIPYTELEASLYPILSQ